MKLNIYIVCVTTTFLTCAAPAAAQLISTTTPAAAAVVDDEPDKAFTGMVALGGAMTPTYNGSDKYQFSPFGLLNVKYRGIQLRALGASLAVNVGGDSNFELGPTIGFSSGRKAADTRGSLDLLDPIDSGIELGGYAGYHFGGNENGEGRILLSVQAAKSMKSGYGFSIEPSVTYAALRREKVFASVDLGMSYNDSKAMRTTFGITPAEAGRSGLAAFRPKGGISQVSGGVTAGYQFTPRWGLIGRAQGGTYIGDAADSPIVKDGSKAFGLFAMGVSYSF